MKKVLFINEQELVEIVELNFGAKASSNVANVEINGDIFVADVIEIHIDEVNLYTIVRKLRDKLNITSSDIYIKKTEDNNTLLLLDFIYLKELLEKKYNVELTANYQPCYCDLFDNPILAFEIK